MKRTVALVDQAHVIEPRENLDGKSRNHTPRKRNETEDSQIPTAPSSTQKTTDQHDRKRPLDNTLKEMIRDYMYNGIVRGMDLKKFITEVESEMALDDSSDTMQSLDEGFEAMTRDSNEPSNSSSPTSADNIPGFDLTAHPASVRPRSSGFSPNISGDDLDMDVIEWDKFDSLTPFDESMRLGRRRLGSRGRAYGPCGATRVEVRDSVNLSEDETVRSIDDDASEDGSESYEEDASDPILDDGSNIISDDKTDSGTNISEGLASVTATKDDLSSDKPLQGTIPGDVTLAVAECRLCYRSCPAAETDAEDGQRANGITSVNRPTLPDSTSPSVVPPSPDSLQITSESPTTFIPSSEAPMNEVLMALLNNSDGDATIRAKARTKPVNRVRSDVDSIVAEGLSEKQKSQTILNTDELKEIPPPSPPPEPIEPGVEIPWFKRRTLYVYLLAIITDRVF